MRRRLFIAIDIPIGTKKKVQKIMEPLIIKYPEKRWEDYHKYHLTVKFLGSTSINPQKIIANVKEKLKSFPAFEIKFGDISIISNKKNNVLVIEPDANEELLKLFYMLNNSLCELGFKREKRKFYPHISLARLNQTEMNIPENINKSLGKLSKITVSEISLFSSQLTKDGSIYNKEGSVGLI